MRNRSLIHVVAVLLVLLLAVSWLSAATGAAGPRPLKLRLDNQTLQLMWTKARLVHDDVAASVFQELLGLEARQIDVTGSTSADPPFTTASVGSRLLNLGVDISVFTKYLIAVAITSKATQQRALGNVSFATPQPRGTMLAVERSAKRSEIWLIDAENRFSYAIARTEESNDNPMWSPDGKALAFFSQSSSVGYRIWMYDINSGRRTLLGRGLTPSWSPDGRALAVAGNDSGRFEVYIIGLDGQRRRFTFHEAHVAYTAWWNGSIFFTSDKSGSRQIWEKNLATGKEALLTSLPKEISANGPAPSPGGTTGLFFVKDERTGRFALFVGGRKFADPILVESDGHNPQWSVDGRMVLYVSNKSGAQRLWRVDLTPFIQSGIP